MTATKSSFGRWLRRLRAEHDLTQESLAERVPCSTQTIRSLESGARRASRDLAERLADVLQVPIGERATFLRLARAPSEADHLDEETSAASPSQSTPQPARPPLTAPASPLIGRDAERSQLNTLFVTERVRLVTLVGLGGVGKTHLALQVAEDLAGHFADGAAFVPLVSATSTAAAAHAVAEALALPLRETANPVQQLVETMARLDLLLVLDNIEHLLDDGAGGVLPLLSALLKGAPGVYILATSRERVRLSDEVSLELSGLPVPGEGSSASADRSSAVQLFVRRAQRIDATFTLTSTNVAAIARICRLVGGVPLAIELASGWVSALNCDEIADEISRSMDFLAQSTRDVPARHRSLRAVCESSWTLLKPAEQETLARLAIFRGGFTRHAATQVADARLPLLAALIDKSLVQRAVVESSATLVEPPAYELHEMLRQFLLEKLAASGELDAVRRRHAAYFVERLKSIEPRLYTDESLTWRRQLAAEEANIREALEWGLSDADDPCWAVRLASQMGRFWYLSDQWRDGLHYLKRALAHSMKCAQQEPEALTMAHTQLGELLLALGQVNQARDHFEAGLAGWRSLNNRTMLAWTLYHSGQLYMALGDYEASEKSMEESLNLFQELGDRRNVAHALYVLGGGAVTRGDFQTARERLREALSFYRGTRYQGSLAATQNEMGRALLGLGLVDEARPLLYESVEICQRIGQKAGLAWAWHSLSLVEWWANNVDEAERCVRRALTLYVELDGKGGCMACMEVLAAVAAARNEPTLAVQRLAAAESQRAVTGQVLSFTEQALHDQTAAAAYAQLGEIGWRAAWLSGQALTFDEAVQQAVTSVQATVA